MILDRSRKTFRRSPAWCAAFGSLAKPSLLMRSWRWILSSISGEKTSLFGFDVGTGSGVKDAPEVLAARAPS